jgi:hypothetical protein
MSLVLVETVREDLLITDEFLQAGEDQLLDCLAERGAHWLYSLLAVDRSRMVCVFDAPDFSAVQDSYRKTSVEFTRIWAAKRLTPDGSPLLRNESMLKVFESTYPEGLTAAQWESAGRSILPCYAAEGVEWVQSYLSRDRTRKVCELNAPDTEVIREAHRRFNIPFDRVWSAIVLKP